MAPLKQQPPAAKDRAIGTILFVNEEEARGVGPADRRKFNATIAKLARPKRSKIENRVLHLVRAENETPRDSGPYISGSHGCASSERLE